MCSTLTVAVLASPNFYVTAGISDLQASLDHLDKFLTQSDVEGESKTIHAHLTEILSFHRWIIG